MHIGVVCYASVGGSGIVAGSFSLVSKNIANGNTPAQMRFAANGPVLQGPPKGVAQSLVALFWPEASVAVIFAVMAAVLESLHAGIEVLLVWK